MAVRRRRSEMGPGQRAAVLIVGSVDLALTVTAPLDLTWAGQDPFTARLGGGGNQRVA